MGKFESERNNGVVHVEDLQMRNGHIWMPCGHDQDISNEELQNLACEVVEEVGDETTHLKSSKACTECASSWHRPRIAWYSFCPPAFWYKRFPSKKEVREQKERWEKLD